jgi:hypothetical protein
MKTDEQLRIGARVLLRGSQSGKPGTVVMVVRGRIAVRWPGIWRLSLHSPANLVLAAAEEDQR